MIVVALMQNPSKASAVGSDRTMDKWCGYMRRWYPDHAIGEPEMDAEPREPESVYRYRLTRTWRALGVHQLTLRVGNIFAFRAMYPRDLWAAARVGNDIIGPENDVAIRRMVASANIVIAAWGCHANAQARALEVRAMLATPLHVLRLSKHGRPEHPLYLPGDIVPVPWMVAT